MNVDPLDLLARAPDLGSAEAALAARPELTRIDEGRYRAFDLTIDLGLTAHLEAVHDHLAAVAPLDLGIAPQEVGLHRWPDGHAALVTRYPAVFGESLVAVPDAAGPFRNAEKTRFLEDVRRLEAAGFAHRDARDPSSWLLASPSGRLVLDGWASLTTRSEGARDPQALRASLDQLPWRRRVVAECLAVARSSRREPEALARAGFPLEAFLVGSDAEVVEVPDGAWAGREVHRTPVPPAPALGRLWFDAATGTPCVFVGTGWLGVRRLSVWQTRGVGPSDDRGAWLATWAEATAEADAWGRTLPGLRDWHAAAEALSPDEFRRLWEDRGAEWTRDTPPDEPVARVVVTALSSRWWPDDAAAILTQDRGQPDGARRASRVGLETRLGVRLFLAARGADGG